MMDDFSNGFYYCEYINSVKNKVKTAGVNPSLTCFSLIIFYQF